VRDALGDRVEILMDGGVRSGLDVFRAVALGASGVLIGRPWAYAVAARGQDGVSGLLAAFQRESVGRNGVVAESRTLPTSTIRPYLSSRTAELKRSIGKKGGIPL